MKVGLYFGSFNPIHNGHLIIGNYFINETALDELWFVVSPQNPFKQKKGLLNENHRFNLIKDAIEGERKMKASNVEFKLPKPSYTVNTLAYLKEKYPENKFIIIMGSDSFQNIHQWKNASIILENYEIYIYKRPNYQIEETTERSNIKIVDAPLIEISSTQIRNLIKQGKSIRYLVPDSVLHQIENQQYYQSELENPTQQQTRENN